MQWEKVSLEDICIEKGQYGGGFSAIPYSKDLPRYIRITDIKENGDLTGTAVSPSGLISDWNKYYLEHGDLLFARSGATVGKTYLHSSNQSTCVFAGYLIRFKLKKDIALPKFVYYFTKSPFYKKWVLNKQNVVAQPNINAKQYGKELQIPLPPLATQKKIAAILDAADAYRQKTKALIGKYEQLGQSLFLEMFGDPVVNPKGWDVNPVIKYCSCIVPGRDKPKSFTGNIPWITTNQLNHLRYTTKENFELGLTEYEIEQVRAKVIPKNSVIITCVGDLGIVSINKLDIVINQQLHAFVCNKVINNVFLMYNISFQKPYMYKMASSTTVPYMNKKVANNIPTIYPPLHLQNQFAERIQAIELQKAKAEESLGKAEALFGVLLQRAFKGELV